MVLTFYFKILKDVLEVL